MVGRFSADDEMGRTVRPGSSGCHVTDVFVAQTCPRSSASRMFRVCFMSIVICACHVLKYALSTVIRPHATCTRDAAVKGFLDSPQ